MLSEGELTSTDVGAYIFLKTSLYSSGVPFVLQSLNLIAPSQGCLACLQSWGQFSILLEAPAKEPCSSTTR